MFRGVVEFRAKIAKDSGLTFTLLDFDPNEPGVEKVEVEATNGNEIATTVHLTSVATHEEGVGIANKVQMEIVDRLSFFYDIAIDNGNITSLAFDPVDPPPAFESRPRLACSRLPGCLRKCRFIFPVTP
jgi:hypothetical protein